MKKVTKKGPELLAIWRQMMEKLLPKFEFSEAEIKDILDKSLRRMQNWPNISCQMKKDPSTTNSTIL
mgnify:CR=1 FL=1